MKLTPSNCNNDKCPWNNIAPPENSQECLACLGLKDQEWKPKFHKIVEK